MAKTLFVIGLGAAVWTMLLFGTRKLDRESAVTISWIAGVVVASLVAEYL